MRLVLVLFASLVLGACSSDSQAERTPTPYDGVWTVAGAMDEYTYWIIEGDLNSGTGTIVVEESGAEARRVDFELIGTDSLKLQGAERGPIEGDEISPVELLGMLRLEDPPRYLHLTHEPPAAFRAADTAVDRIMYVGGFLPTLPIPMIRVPDTQRVAVPFDIQADVNLEMGDFTAHFEGGDGPWGGGMTFDEPVHPTGSVRSLSVQGYDIPLTDTVVHDGMLSTSDFGDVEVQVTGSPGEIHLLATRAQIRAMYGKYLAGE